jgi:hypothetical protein
MNKQNFITLTLIISNLAFNPVMADTIFTTAVSQSQKINNRVTSDISSVLYKRGLDKEAADEISENFVSEVDEVLLAMTIQELDRENIASRKEVLEYLSTTALYKQKFNFHSYDHLVGMVTKIRQRSLDSMTLKKLHTIAKSNQQFVV